MKLISTSIPDVKIFEPQVFGDERGFFMETFRDSWFRENVADVEFVQDNQSKSSKGTLRGLHIQTKNTQGKLVRVTKGEVYDVALDMRKESPTLGQWIGCLLNDENKRQMWIPEGFAHGFFVKSEIAEFVYKCTDYYSPEFEQTILWNDSLLSIDWPIEAKDQVKLSAKDEAGLLFENATKL